MMRGVVIIIKGEECASGKEICSECGKQIWFSYTIVATISGNRMER